MAFEFSKKKYKIKSVLEVDEIIYNIGDYVKIAYIEEVTDWSTDIIYGKIIKTDGRIVKFDMDNILKEYLIYLERDGKIFIIDLNELHNIKKWK